MKHILSILLLCIVMAFGCEAGHGGYAIDPIHDLALIYQGGVHRLNWSEDDFKPFVEHTFYDGERDWLFDGFLFLEFTDGRGNAFGNGCDRFKSKKGNWQWLLNRLFTPGYSLDALDKCISSTAKAIGKPSFRHKVVLGIPSPLMSQTDWGELDGVKLDFNNREHQQMAVRWYVDLLVKRFKQAKYKNIDLTGIYWIDEDSIHCGNLPALVGDYLKDKGLRFYWIPYYKARGWDEWRKLGFDIAYLQPNHFFDARIPDSRLDDACRLATSKNMAMEFEFDSRARKDSRRSFYRRMWEYISRFERNGVFGSSAIAYYSGSRGMLDMHDSPSLEDKALLDYLARNIVRRHRNNNFEPKNKLVKIVDGSVYVAEKLTHDTDIVYEFRKCMFNKLFTFHKIGFMANSGSVPVSNPECVDMKVVNKTSSDNIGPIGICGGGWAGGNHSYSDKGELQTAESKGVWLNVDGKIISLSDTIMKAANVEIYTDNDIFNPLSIQPDSSFSEVLCRESVTYAIGGGSIQVSVWHDFKNKEKVNITKYYGMQSMFCNETSIYTPLGKYGKWTRIEAVDRFPKKDFPEFRHFIEKSDAGYQSAYLLPEGIGTHSSLDADGRIFIGNSYSKSYHSQLMNVNRQDGDIDFWSGVYTWFEKPLVETDALLVFPGMVDYRKVLFVSCSKAGKYEVPLPEGVLLKECNVFAPGIKWKARKRCIELELPDSFSGIIKF